MSDLTSLLYIPADPVTAQAAAGSASRSLGGSWALVRLVLTAIIGGGLGYKIGGYWDK